MDDEEDTSKCAHFICEESKSKQTTTHPDIEKLRKEIERQAKTIDSWSETVAVLEAERTQTCNAFFYLQAELHNMARQLVGQNLMERFEALHCEMSMELHNLRSLLPPSTGHAPCCPSASCSSPTVSEFQNQATIIHISQELCHCRRTLWEQIGELREEVHKIQSQLNIHRVDVLKRLAESYHKTTCMERMIDTCQAQESSIQKLLSLQDASRVRSNMSELQTELQNIVISKGKAPKKTGHGMKTDQGLLLQSSDSDEGLNPKQMKTAKSKEPVDATARRK